MEKHPVVVRDETIRAVLVGLYLLALFAVLLFSNRPLLIGNMPNVVAGMAIPPGSARADASAVLDGYAVHVPKLRHAALALARLGLVREVPFDETAPRPLSFGYSIIETDILGMPFWFRSDDGYIVYDETPDEFRTLQVMPQNLRALRITATDTLPWWQMPWWAHLWGWAFVLAGGALGLFELGAVRRRREAEGLI